MLDAGTKHATCVMRRKWKGTGYVWTQDVVNWQVDRVGGVHSAAYTNRTS